MNLVLPLNKMFCLNMYTFLLSLRYTKVLRVRNFSLFTSNAHSLNLFGRPQDITWRATCARGPRVWDPCSTPSGTGSPSWEPAWLHCRLRYGWYDICPPPAKGEVHYLCIPHQFFRYGQQRGSRKIMNKSGCSNRFIAIVHQLHTTV